MVAQERGRDKLNLPNPLWGDKTAWNWVQGNPNGNREERRLAKHGAQKHARQRRKEEAAKLAAAHTCALVNRNRDTDCVRCLAVCSHKPGEGDSWCVSHSHKETPENS